MRIKKDYDNTGITSENRAADMTADRERTVKTGRLDYPFVALVLLIVFVGLVMVYSTSAYRGMELFGDSAYFAKRQLVFAVSAIIIAYFVSKADYRLIAKYSKLILIISMVLLILVYIIGTASHGSARWLYIGPFGFQPSECAKVALIIYTAAACTAHTKSLNSVKGNREDYASSDCCNYTYRHRKSEYGYHMLCHCFYHFIYIQPEDMVFYCACFNRCSRMRAVYSICRISGGQNQNLAGRLRNILTDIRPCSHFTRLVQAVFLAEDLETVFRRWVLYRNHITT